jgi:hypothetical protein
LPASELREVNASPVPAQTRSAFEGATATAPIFKLFWASKTGWKVVPLFVVFQIPPVQKETEGIEVSCFPRGRHGDIGYARAKPKWAKIAERERLQQALVECDWGLGGS